MTVNELIEHLKQLDGNLSVYATSDHGQTPEKVCTPQEIFIEEEAHTLWDGFSTHAEDAEEYGYTVKAVLI